MLWNLRLFAMGMALLSLTACNSDAPGTPDDAASAASDFLSLLVERNADEAWTHLTPATRSVAYDDDQTAFAEDVQAADWSTFEWEIGQVTDYEISWGVNVIVEDQAVPSFLYQEGVAGTSEQFGVVLLVQLTDAGYMIAGPALDE